ncbi:hypothetical protein L6172_15860 [Thalassospiraceae bacterium SW-3-3]|nr:hypothetical protein L6172_15860 [Thalassospiraceae bacterium SW-3-3]
MIRADNMTMMFVLLFAVAIAWLQVSVEDQQARAMLVPVPDYGNGLEVYSIRHDPSHQAACGSMCGAFDLTKAAGIEGGFMQASLPGRTAQR